MSNYALLNDSHTAVVKYPYSLGEVISDNPQISFSESPNPQSLIAVNVVVVVDSAVPVAGEGEVVEEGTPVRERARNFDGTLRADDPRTPLNEAWVWRQNWVTRDMNENEIAERDAAIHLQKERERTAPDVLLKTLQVIIEKTIDPDTITEEEREAITKVAPDWMEGKARRT
jgi:hypothetical protein